MTKHIDTLDQYAASTDQIWAMLLQQAYWDAKYAALGATNLEWLEFSPSGDTLKVSSVRHVVANLPAAAKKIVGETTEVTQTEEWTRTGDELTSKITINTKGLPGGFTGASKITPSDAGSSWKIDLDIKVAIPFLGKKLEGVAYDETGDNFKQEKVFNDTWLSEH
jgi:hypothetical protein